MQRESRKIPCARCRGRGLLSWRSHLCCTSHDPLPGTPAREKSVAVSMATGSGRMSARGGGRRDCRACSKCGLLFLIAAATRRLGRAVTSCVTTVAACLTANSISTDAVNNKDYNKRRQGVFRWNMRINPGLLLCFSARTGIRLKKTPP